MAADIIYLCDHDYECANSLFCELNGGECKHTSQFKHSRNKPHISDISTDERFEREVRTTDPLTYIYIEKEDSQKSQTV